jgi:hypothetical protein
MKEVAMECYRILKPEHFCAILIGDTKRSLHYKTVVVRKPRGVEKAKKFKECMA